MRDDRPSFFSPAVIAVFVAVFAATAGLIFYATRSGTEPAPVEAAPVKVAPPVAPKVAPESAPSAPATGVIDSTTDLTTKPVIGSRHKVRVGEISNGGDAGVARIGGVVTFIKGLGVGDLAVVEIVNVKQTTADARLVEKLESGRPVSRGDERRREPRPDREGGEDEVREKKWAEVLPAGGKHTAKIVGTGRDGDGVAYVKDKVVFVSGAKEGEVVEFEITEEKERFAVGRVLAQVDDLPADDVPATEKPAPDYKKVMAQPVEVGEEYDIEITEDDRKNPGVNGVTRIRKLVVFVPGLKIGDRARVRITEVRERTATAEVISRSE